jgi:3-oxoacyl-(acyl-carrier-protein) synthase
MHGSADFSANVLRRDRPPGLHRREPGPFAEGVPNAAAAHLSLMLGLRVPCQTIIGSRTSGLDALRLAATRIRSGEWTGAIIGAGEEYSAIVNEAPTRTAGCTNRAARAGAASSPARRR